MLDVKDCRFDLGDHGKVHVRFGKGSRGSGYKSRFVPMLDSLKSALALVSKGCATFIHLSQRWPAVVFQKMGRELIKIRYELAWPEDKKPWGSLLRRCLPLTNERLAFASTLTERGVDLLTLKELLGHVEISTTFLYTTPGSDYVERRVRLAQEKWRKRLARGRGETRLMTLKWRLRQVMADRGIWKGGRTWKAHGTESRLQAFRSVSQCATH